MNLYKVIDGKVVSFVVLDETAAGCRVMRSGSSKRRPRWLVRGKEFDIPEYGQETPEFFFTEDEAREAYDLELSS